MAAFRVTLSRGAEQRDVTAAVLALRWRIGMRRPYNSVAAPASGEIVLNNRDQSASPELDPDGLFAPGSAVVIEVDDGGWQPLFTGIVARAEPDMGEHSPRRTIVFVEGADAALSRVVIRAAVMADVRSDEVLDTILDTPPLDTIPRDLGTGASSFAYVGDQWGSGLSAASAVRQVADAERGRVYMTRGGTLTFRGRHAGLSSVTPDATFDAEADAARMAYGAGMVNQVRIGLRPRSLGTPASTLWTLSNAQRLRPGAQLTLIAPLRDAQGRRAGAVSVITPVATTDYSANTAADGTGTDATASVGVAVLALEGSAAKLRLTNTGSGTVYLMPGARLRGTPLLGGQPAAVEVSDDDSVADFGLHALDLLLPLLDSVETADLLGAWELSKRAQPGGAVLTLTLSDRTRYADALALTLFDRIRIVDAHTGHDRIYWIIGEAHTVTLGGARHIVVFTLEPAPALVYWTVGVSELGTETRLAV